MIQCWKLGSHERIEMESWAEVYFVISVVVLLAILIGLVIVPLAED